MELSWESVAVGFRFIWRSETILGAMLFEFMASLFGSVQALLPIYARDILGVGAWGAGLLRSATALGGLLAAAVLTRMPIKSAGGLLAVRLVRAARGRRRSRSASRPASCSRSSR